MRNSYIYRKASDIARLSPKIRTVMLRIAWWSFFYELLKIIPPIVFKQIIDQLVAYDPAVGFTPELLLYLLLGYAGGLLVMSLMDVFLQRVGDHGIRDAEEDVTNRTFEKLLALDVSYHERHSTGTSVNKILKGHAKLVELLYNVLNGFLPVIFQTLITLAVLLFLSWKVGLLFLLFIPLFTLIILHGARKTQAAREEYHAQHDAYAGVVTQSIANIRTVKDFASEQKELARSRTYLRKYLDAVTERIRIGLTNLLVQDVLVATARVATLVIAVYLMVRGEITAGSLVLIVTLSEKAYLNLTRLSRTYYRIQDSEPSIDRFNAILDEPIRITDNPESAHQVTEGRIEFDHVSFRYDAGRTEALSDVTFAILPKQTVALVGRSGSGKSTVVKLLLRLEDPTGGRILIDGVPTSEYSFAALRGQMAVVAQDVELFNETIRDNIGYGVENASHDDVVRAAQMASAHDFIMRLPKGYETVVGERGVKLSGGQKQRIAIARALLRHPKILVFDEATSSLDAESEKAIHDAILHLSGKLTLIIIAHRFSTIERADRIILLEKGGVAEEGTHEQLIKRQGIFAKLRKLQEL